MICYNEFVVNFPSIKIIFEDNDILVIDKPAGLVVDKSQTSHGDTLEDWLREHENNLNRAGIVHRLDKDTSGVLLVAKTQNALDNLQAQFKERVIKKQYLALVHGLINEPGKVEGAIARNPGDKGKFTVLEEGKEASTEYEPVGKLKIQNSKFKTMRLRAKIQTRKLERMNYNRFTLVRCYPKTGRTHQIRVHLKYKGFSIVADEKYVGRKMYRLDHRWCPRQFLHAARIGFKHPVSGVWMEIESELPEDLKKVLWTIFSYNSQ